MSNKFLNICTNTFFLLPFINKNTNTLTKAEHFLIIFLFIFVDIFQE